MRARTWDGDKMIYLKLGQCKDYEVDFVFRQEDNPDGMWIDDHVGEVKWPFMLGSGLEDKNGKYIYEGDILKGHDGFIYRVWKTKGGFVINVHVDKFKNDIQMNQPFPSQPLADEQTVSYVESSCIVIGNIYETPKLING